MIQRDKLLSRTCQLENTRQQKQKQMGVCMHASAAKNITACATALQLLIKVIQLGIITDHDLCIAWQSTTASLCVTTENRETHEYVGR
jgi:hypothetical protein